VEKSLMIYDAKGMRIERKTFDAKGTLVETKKYQYEY